MWFGNNKTIVYLDDTQVRFMQIPLVRERTLAEQALEALVQAQDHLQYDETQDELAFCCTKDTDKTQVPTGQQQALSNTDKPILGIAVASKTTIAQAATRAQKVGYLHKKQFYCLRPSWRVLQQRKRKMFWLSVFLCFFVPGIIAWFGAQNEEIILQKQRLALQNVEQAQAQQQAVREQIQAQKERLQTAQHNWQMLMQSMHTLEQKMPQGAYLQQLVWQKQKLQIEGYSAPPAVYKISQALATLWPDASFVIEQNALVHGHLRPTDTIAFTVVRSW